MNDVEVTFEQSATIGALAEALAAAQSEIGNAPKDSVNPHFNRSYADLAAVRDASRPLSRHKVAVVQQVTTRGPDVGVRTMLLHASGEWMASTAFLKPDKPGPQAAGSVITYLRRYMLAAALGIAQEDDDAESATSRNAEPTQPAERKGPRAVVAKDSGGQDHAEAKGEIPPTAKPTAKLPPVEVAKVRQALDKVLPLANPADPKAAVNNEARKQRAAYVYWAAGVWLDDSTGLAGLTAAQAQMVSARANAGEVPPIKGAA